VHAVTSHEEENLPPVKSQPSIINRTAQILPELVKPDRFHATLNAAYKLDPLVSHPDAARAFSAGPI